MNAKLMDYELSPDWWMNARLAASIPPPQLAGRILLHNRILDCVRYAKQKGIMEVSTLTNGLRLDEDMFRELMEAGLDWITISFDGIGATYEQIRRPIKYDRAVEKISNYARIKQGAGRVKPVVKIQSILPAIENDPKTFYDVFAPISDMVSANPLIDFMQSKRDIPKIGSFSCPQIYQRQVVGADGLCLMCANDEEGKLITGDANRQSIHEIWHGAEMTRVRDIHRRCAGALEIGACAECYLPLETYEEDVAVGGRTVSAEKYVSSTQKVVELKTPDRFKRKELKV